MLAAAEAEGVIPACQPAGGERRATPILCCGWARSKRKLATARQLANGKCFGLRCGWATGWHGERGNVLRSKTRLSAADGFTLWFRAAV